MSTEKNIQTVKDFFAAIGRGDKEGLLALVAEDIEWSIPGQDWPLAGTHRGHAGVAAALQKASAEMPFTYPEPPEYVAQGDRVFGPRLRQGEDQRHEQVVRGLFRLRHHRPGWKAHEHPRIRGYASPGAGRQGWTRARTPRPSTPETAQRAS